MKKKLALLLAVTMIIGLFAGCCLKHDWEDATCDDPMTCSKCGKTEGEPLSHKWKKATCENPKTCALCGRTRGDALGHTWEEATFETPKTCATCGETEGEPLPNPFQGTWYCRQDDTPENARDMLEALDFYEEEIDVVDLYSLDEIIAISFHEGDAYTIGYDVDGLKDCVREFLLLAYDSMYSERQDLGYLYGEDFSTMSWTEFGDYYAGLYGFNEFDELIDYFVENIYKYDQMEITETGTYTTDGDQLQLTKDDGEVLDPYTYQVLSDGTLEIVTNEETMIFTR